MTQSNSRAVFEAFRNTDNESKLEFIIKSLLTEKQTEASSSRMPPFMVPYDPSGRISSLWGNSTDSERKELIELVESCVRVGGDRRRIETAIQVRLTLWIVKRHNARKSSNKPATIATESGSPGTASPHTDGHTFPDAWIPVDVSNELRESWTKLDDERKHILLEKVRLEFPKGVSSKSKPRLIELFQNISGKGADVEIPSENETRVASNTSADLDRSSPDNEDTIESGTWEAEEIMNVRLEKSSPDPNVPRKVSILVRLTEGSTIWVDADLLLSSRIVDSLRETLARIR